MAHVKKKKKEEVSVAQTESLTAMVDAVETDA